MMWNGHSQTHVDVVDDKLDNHATPLQRWFIIIIITIIIVIIVISSPPWYDLRLLVLCLSFLHSLLAILT